MEEKKYYYVFIEKTVEQKISTLSTIIEKYCEVIDEHPIDYLLKSNQKTDDATIENIIITFYKEIKEDQYKMFKVNTSKLVGSK